MSPYLTTPKRSETTKMNLPKNANDYTSFMIYSGYVESSAISPLIISTEERLFPEEEFSDWEKAWETSFLSMRDAFLKIVRIHHGIPDDPNYFAYADRCHMDLVDNLDYRYCHKCGTSLSAIRSKRGEQNDPYVWTDMVGELMRWLVAGTNDSTGYDLWETMGDHGWTLGGWAHLDGIATVIFEHGESFLANFGTEHQYLTRKSNGFWESVGLYRMKEIEGYGRPR